MNLETQAVTRYCPLCRNVTVTREDLCAKCDSQVRHGWLAAAYRHFVEAQERFGRACCSGLSYRFGRDEAPDAREQGHIYLHPKHWEASNDTVGVEYGIEFHDSYATTYYLRDFDSVADSATFGEQVQYLDPDFWTKLESQADRAAEFADADGLITCERCGYHAYDSCDCEPVEE
jgi:hypothetical protein